MRKDQSIRIACTCFVFITEKPQRITSVDVNATIWSNVILAPALFKNFTFV